MRRTIPSAALALLAGIAAVPLPVFPHDHVQASPSHDITPADLQWARRQVRAMSLDEKIALLHGQFLMLVSPSRRPAGITLGAGYVAGNARLGIPAQVATDATLGVSNLLDMRKGDVATALPSGMALAASWNPALARNAGRMIGSEARAKGFNVMLAGGVNLVRDPRAGRNFEYFGEDPLLGGTLAGSLIDGVQSNAMIATIKHFAANDQETGRSSASVEIDEAAFRESDLLAFQIGIETGHPGAVMCAYNRVGGIHACENPFLLTDVLRRDWHWQGFVMSDWGAVHSTGALQAGLDQQQGEQLDRKRWLSTELSAAVQAGTVPVAAVDTAATRILASMHAHGLIAKPPATAPIDYAHNSQTALQAEEQGVVLLRNEHALLPLGKTVRQIAVIGGHADIGVLSGGGSSQVTPVGGFRLVEPLKSGAAAGFGRRAWGGTAPLDAIRAAFPDATVSFVDGTDQAAAATAAHNADVAIVFAEKFATEAADQPDLSLDGNQDSLITAVAQANPASVVVLETGNAVAMPWLDQVPAVLAAWFPGQRGGEAIARILSGAVNPSGHLPVTFPAGVAQLPNPRLPGTALPPPSQADRATYGVNTNSPPFDIRYPEGSDVGYRWFDRTKAKPLFAFGHGLSYTSFGYDALHVAGGKTVTVRFRVTNTGTRAGADVPQVYISRPGMPLRLVGWARPVLSPGESRFVTVVADRRLLGRFDPKSHRWVVASGPITVAVAHNAQEIALRANTRLAPSTIRP